MAGDREAYLAAGMSDYVSGPIVFESLLAAIARQAPGAGVALTGQRLAPAPPAAPSVEDEGMLAALGVDLDAMIAFTSKPDVVA